MLRNARVVFVLLSLAGGLACSAASAAETAYDVLGRLFDQGSLPVIASIEGDWAGRYFPQDQKNLPHALGLRVAVSFPGGPLFGASWSMCAGIGPSVAMPGYFDSGDAEAWLKVSCTFRYRTTTVEQGGSLLNYLSFGQTVYRQELRKNGAYLIYRSFPCEYDASAKRVGNCDLSKEDRGYFFKKLAR